MKKALLFRFGGIGDCAPVMVASQQLKKRGWHVTLALRDDAGAIKQSDLLKNTNVCDEVLDLRQVGPWGTRCVKYKDGWKSIESIYDDYDNVVDFMFVTEGNSTCRTNFVKKPTDVWKVTRNSNWINWYDQHLAWVGIDPYSVPNEEKRPTFLLSKEERKEAKKLRKGYSKLFAIHPVASSMARTWYQAKDLVPMLHEEYKDCLIACWDPGKNDWDFVVPEGRFPMKIKSDSPLRRSMIVLGACDLFIGVDTGFTHIAEGMGVEHVAIYSTVPGWTRAKYYKYQTIIDPGIEHPEYYNFGIQAGDPLRIEDGMNALTEREKQVKVLYDRRAPLEEVIKELNCDKHGAELEVEIFLKKQESWDRQQSKALSDVSVDMVMDKVKELIK